MFNEDGVNGVSKNKVNGEINPPYLLDTITLCSNKEVHSGIFWTHPYHQGSGRKKMTPMIPPTTRLPIAPIIFPNTMTIQAWGINIS